MLKDLTREDWLALAVDFLDVRITLGISGGAKRRPLHALLRHS